MHILSLHRSGEAKIPIGLTLPSLTISYVPGFLLFFSLPKIVTDQMATNQTMQQYGDVSGKKIFIAVVTSRQNFPTRVRAIANTWGKEAAKYDRIILRYFVGASNASMGSLHEQNHNQKLVSVEREATTRLAKEGGLDSPSSIVVMSQVDDDEYPPVRKNSNMIKQIETLLSRAEGELPSSKFQWIFKVDDDTYVNVVALLQFTNTRNHNEYRAYGEKGTGAPNDRQGLAKGGLVKPYCMGGPGYIFSRPLLAETASGMDQCVNEADTSEYRGSLWHSDVIIGLCAYKMTGAGCWDEEDYEKHPIFRHNYEHEDPFLNTSELPRTISMHPFKSATAMLNVHKRVMATAEA